jgi:hypothetical protein
VAALTSNAQFGIGGVYGLGIIGFSFGGGVQADHSNGPQGSDFGGGNASQYQVNFGPVAFQFGGEDNVGGTSFDFAVGFGASAGFGP